MCHTVPFNAVNIRVGFPRPRFKSSVERQAGVIADV